MGKSVKVNCGIEKLESLNNNINIIKWLEEKPFFLIKNLFDMTRTFTIKILNTNKNETCIKRFGSNSAVTLVY